MDIVLTLGPLVVTVDAADVKKLRKKIKKLKEKLK